MALTDTAIRNAKPKDKSYVLNDGRGLNLEISPKGGKWWRLRYTFDGKPNRISLGTYPDISLQQARERREEARKLIAQGIDPSAARKEVSVQEQLQAETFELVAREWHTRFTPTWTPGHAARILISLEKDVFPWIGPKAIRSILPPEVLSVARRVESRGAIETAHRLVGNIGMVFRYAVASGLADSDPTRDLRGALSPTNEKHYPTITDHKAIGELLRALDNNQSGLVVRIALRILPYVFTRPGELRGMEWSELDLNGETPTWNIPAERMKMRRKHLVPLAPQVLALLQELRPLTGSGRLVFPGQRTNARPISDATLGVALCSVGFGREQIVPHGFRALASTALNEMGYNRDWIEAQLAHAEGNSVRSAYNHAQYLTERRRMMLAWANHLDALREGGKVVPLFRAVGEE